jgi:hypothetical protein
MMRKMKKFLLVVVLLFGSMIFIACDDSGDDDGSNDEYLHYSYIAVINNSNAIAITELYLGTPDGKTWSSGLLQGRTIGPGYYYVARSASELAVSIKGVTSTGGEVILKNQSISVGQILAYFVGDKSSEITSAEKYKDTLRLDKQAFSSVSEREQSLNKHIDHETKDNADSIREDCIERL